MCAFRNSGDFLAHSFVLWYPKVDYFVFSLLVHLGTWHLMLPRFFIFTFGALRYGIWCYIVRRNFSFSLLVLWHMVTRLAELTCVRTLAVGETGHLDTIQLKIEQIGGNIYKSTQKQKDTNTNMNWNCQKYAQIHIYTWIWTETGQIGRNTKWKSGQLD